MAEHPRDLDRAVSIALGYPADMPEALVVRYSTDAACIPEMVDWLKRVKDTASPMYADITIRCLSDTDTFAELWTRCRDCYEQSDHDEREAEAQGVDIQQALARLVVAVAKEAPRDG